MQLPSCSRTYISKISSHWFPQLRPLHGFSLFLRRKSPMINHQNLHNLDSSLRTLVAHTKMLTGPSMCSCLLLSGSLCSLPLYLAHFLLLSSLHVNNSYMLLLDVVLSVWNLSCSSRTKVTALNKQTNKKKWLLFQMEPAPSWPRPK